MHNYNTTGLSAVGFGIAGVAVPVVFPDIEPWVAKGMLSVAAACLILALILWFFRPKEPDGGGITQSPTTQGANSPALAVAGDYHAALASTPITQSHSGIGHNIIASNVHLVPPEFEFSDNFFADLLSKLETGKPIHLDTVGDNKKGRRLYDFLQSHGFTVERTHSSILHIQGGYKKPVDLEYLPDRTRVIFDPS